MSAHIHVALPVLMVHLLRVSTVSQPWRRAAVVGAHSPQGWT